jgi:hypothetical protein
MPFANFSFLFFPSDRRMGVAVSLISVQIYGYIPTKAHKLRKFLSVTLASGKKWAISLFSTFLRFFPTIFYHYSLP